MKYSHVEKGTVVIETQHGCYSDSGWCYLGIRDSLEDAIKEVKGNPRLFSECRIVDREGEVLYDEEGNLKLTKEEKDLILHMTGSTGKTKKKGQGWRNYGAFTLDSPAYFLMKNLEDRGYCQSYARSQNLIYFFVTEKGCIEAGMTKAGIQRATKGIRGGSR